MKEIIVIDLDGTTLADGQTIAPKTLTVLQQVQAHGHEIVIATGRPLNAMAHFAEQIQPTAMITSNGAVVMKYLAGQADVIERHTLASEHFAQALAQVKCEIDTIWLEAHDQTFINHLHPHLAVIFASHRPMGFTYEQKELVNSDYEQAQVCLLLLKKTGSEKQVVKQLETNLGEMYQLHYFEQAEIPFVEISLKQVSKATGLAVLNQVYGWQFTDMIAFGDQYNDQEMLQAVGHGVAMKNAPLAIQQLADAVTSENNIEGGVGVYLQNYLK